MIRQLLRTTVVIVGLVALAWAAGKDYSDGYCEGYKAGWCYGKGACIEPICPITPIPRVGEDSWQDGYNRGFVKGLTDRTGG